MNKVFNWLNYEIKDEEMSEVYVVKAESPQLYPSISRLFDYFSLQKNMRKIAIKLNLCDYRTAESGATSDPFVVETLIKVLREREPGATIYLVENDASGTQADTLFSLLGFNGIAEGYGCKLINLANQDWMKKQINGLRFKSVRVPRILEECDLLINHPKLKTHGLTKVSVGLKNMFGCLKPKYKVRYHESLDEAIVDVNLAIHSDLTVVDGYIGLEKWGPTFGAPKRTGLFIGGKDVVSVDAFCARLMGFRPYFVGHIRKAASKGIGRMGYILKGELKKGELKDYRFDFDYLKHLLNAAFSEQLK